MNFSVSCLVLASDVYGDTSNATTQTKVNPISTATLSLAIGAATSLAMKTSNVDVIASVVSAATSSLNSVDCSLVSGCKKKYNRKPCSVVANTCSECLSGYIGVTGSSNSFCAPTSTSSSILKRSLSSSISAVSSSSTLESRIDLAANFLYIDGSLCQYDSDCFSDSCYLGVCAPSKLALKSFML